MIERRVGTREEWLAARETIVDAAAPFRRPDGSYRFENRFRYIVAQAWRSDAVHDPTRRNEDAP